MFRYILKRLGTALNISTPDNCPRDTLSGDLAKDLATITALLPAQNDTIARTLELWRGSAQVALVYVESLNKPTIISDMVIKPLLQLQEVSEDANRDALHIIKHQVLAVGEMKQTLSVESVVDSIMAGDTALLIQGTRTVLLLGTSSPEIRPVSESETEVGVRGSREGFTETLRTNISQIRRRLKDPALTFETMKLGTRTKTDVAIAYIYGLTSEALIKEVRARVGRINTLAILESGYIEQFIEDSTWSPFSLVANSERPDSIASKLLEGKVAILVDGSPTTLTVPMAFVESFHTPEDYYSRPFYVTLVRVVRFVSFFLALTGPAIYVALTSFHPEIIPTSLLVTIAAAAEGTPLPTYLEILVMLLVFEILREAALRMPRAMGQAVSIVGTLVIGQAVIQAGVVGAPVVIVISITALATFVVLPQTDATSVLRVALIVAAAIAGLYGTLIVLFFVLVHLCSLRSFGVPYLEPLGPLKTEGLKDVVLRYPLKNLKQEEDDGGQE